MIKDELIFRKELEKTNSFWFNKKISEKEEYPIEREEVEEIAGDLAVRKISIIMGSRRTGKSVIIKHLISRLIEDKVNPRNILYYSLEDPYLKIYCDNLIEDSFSYWSENIAEEGKRYVFFDEIHFIDEWYKWIKKLYDTNKNIKFFISGSSSLTLQKEANKYLKGRYITHEIWPLSFRQFLKLKGKKIENIEFTEFEIDKILINYGGDFKEFLLVGGFPEFLEIKDMDKWFEVLKNFISNKAIYEDIATTFKIRNVKILEQIFTFIIANQSRILSYEKINEVAGLKHEILLNYIEYLKSSYLIIEILKYAKNVKEQFKSKKKFLCVDQGLRNSILRSYRITEENEGFIIENVIGKHIYVSMLKKNVMINYYRVNGEVDFIVNDKEILLIEAKYRKSINDVELNKFKELLEVVNGKKIYIVTKNIFKKIKYDNREIILIPALVFCLFIERFL